MEKLRAPLDVTPKAGSASEAALVKAIADDFDSNAPRLVYADFLSERGDSRGEYLALALGGHKTKAARHFKEHAATILGPLFPLKSKPLEMERGLLHTFMAKNDKVSFAEGPALDHLLSDLRWATIHTLDLWPYGSENGALEKVLARAPLWSLRVLKARSEDDFFTVTGREFPWRIQRIALALYEAFDATRWAQGDARNVTELEELEVPTSALPGPAFFESALLKQLKVLRMGSENFGGAHDLAGWILGLRGLGALQVDLRCASIGFTWKNRDVVFTVDERARPEDAGFLSNLDGLGRLTKQDVGRVTIDSKASAEAHARVDAATKHLR